MARSRKPKGPPPEEHLGPKGKVGPDAQPRGAIDKRLGRVHDRIIDALSRIDGGAPGDRALSEVFKSARDLGSNERHHVGDVVYGVLRERRRIDDVLKRAAKGERRSLDLVDPPILNRLRVLTYLAEHGASEAELAALDRYASKRLPGVLPRIVKGRVSPSKLTGVERIATERSLPSFVATMLVDAFGEDRAELIASGLAARAPVTLRVNRRATDRDTVLARLREDFDVEAKPTPLVPDGIILSGRVDLYNWAPYREGQVELQDEGSQLIALALGVQDGDVVLDACAGAGGKALAIAAMADARVVAMDPDGKKLKALELRRERADARISAKKGELETLDEEAKYDRVLVDAPCTGTGTFRRHPDLKWRLKPEDATKEIARQKHLLTSAAATMKVGGVLVYATCSVLREENEDVVRHALDHDRRLEALPLATTLGDDIASRLGASHEARIGPGPKADGPDGFYVAAMRRRA
ncbi:MAG: RsmB/NOP family class I SAM-dependent RNA methyltransferase [Deltaproteobacteria bacterium]